MSVKIIDQPDPQSSVSNINPRQKPGVVLPRLLTFLAGIGTMLVLFLAYNLIAPGAEPLTLGQVEESISEAMTSATPAPAFSSLVYRAVSPSLVFIQVEKESSDRHSQSGIGSGVIVNEAGDILTSLHVVADAVKIEVTFADGTQSLAEVLVEQPDHDIAVLRAFQPPSQIVPAVLGNPNTLAIGDEAYVIGHPLGLAGSMSAGIISGFGRSFQPVDSDQLLEDLIQIDAAVNPGNSGGPLLNRYGQVVGIVTALANPTEQNFFIGIGFAVPITIAGGAAGMPLH
jgi:S1-C subfamily serine protease